MPLYDYTCQACGHAFEYLARTLADRPQTCPKCGAQQLVKGFSRVNARVSAEGGTCPHREQCGHAHGAGCGCGCCH